MSELERMRAREEILQAMFWMRAEGILEAPTAAQLARFLAVPATSLAPRLADLVDQAYLKRDQDLFQLTSKGEELGKRAFADEFADMTRPAHGECDDDCWCHSSPEEAAKCLEERAEHVHSG